MAQFRARDLMRLCESHGYQAVEDSFNKAAEAGKPVTLNDYSIRDLAQTFLGESWVKPLARLAVAEAGQPVMSTNFSNIVGQLIFSTIRQQFQHEGFYFSSRIPTVQTSIAGAETVPSISPMGDESQQVGEGQEYPSVIFTEEYFTAPAKVKQGMKVEVTEEMIFFDKTNQVNEAARMVGYMLGLKKEKNLIDVFSGQTNNYIRNGTATNTYLTAGAYINNQSSVDLQDWTDIEIAEQLLRENLHPKTGEPLAPIAGGRLDLVVMPRKKYTAKQIINATQSRSTLGTNIELVSSNPLDSFNLLADSELLYQRVLATIESVAATARDIWWLGSIADAFRWYENWPLSVEQASNMSAAAFERDVVLAYRARYRGVAAVWEPRYIVRMENAAV